MNTIPTTDAKNLTLSAINKEQHWMILAGSVQGKSHISSDIPRQDAFALLKIAKGWSVCAVADGAGSCPLSHVGANYVVTSVVKLVKEWVLKTELLKHKELPSENTWKETATDIFLQQRKKLEQFAEKHAYILKDLSSTLIVLVITPFGILTAHVGDGRAGYRNEECWHPCMFPLHGEEANMTVFLPVLTRENSERFLQTSIYGGTYDAFTLMSDGCERYAFYSCVLNTETNIYEDSNTPSADFFDPVCKILVGKKQSGATNEELCAMWVDFLANGSQQVRFEQEPDDRTLVIGVRY